MSDDLQSLYRELKNHLTQELLKSISVKIITLFREKRFTSLAVFARRAGIDPSHVGTTRTFFLLMQRYHPDKLASILLELDRFSDSGDLAGMTRLKETYIYEEISAPVVEYEPEEEDFSFAEDDFGYTEREQTTEPVYGDEPYEEDHSETAEEREEDEEEERNFTEAVNLHFYGNLDEAVTVSDMNNLDGELDLSDCGISTLAGAEHCFHLASLNLSGNRIVSVSRLSKMTLLETLYLSENLLESVEPLAGLIMLKELDLSFNRIDDISALQSLTKLEYLNIMGNQLKDRTVIITLLARGVIVIE